MVERWDAVVVGAGLGGLSAAVTLTIGGKRTVVLEQHSAAGGYASAFERAPYRFDTALHALSGLAPGGGVDTLYRDLGIRDRLHLQRLDPLYVLRGPGREIVAHADIFAYEAELLRHFPAQADQIRACLDDTCAVYHDVIRLGIDQQAGRRPDLDMLGARYPAMMRASGETWDQMMARHVTDPEIRSALAAFTIYMGLPPSRLAALAGALMTGSYHEHGGWYPIGGAQALTAALVRSLHDHGGEIRYGQLVTGFDIADDRVAAVTTEQGTRIEAETVVSNASAPTTMLELVGGKYLPAEYVERVERPAPSYTTFAVYLGLERDVLAEHGLAHELLLYPSWDFDAIWQPGNWDIAPLTITDYTGVDPGCAPEGHAAVVLTTIAGWDYENIWGTSGEFSGYHNNPRYLELKKQAADALVRRADSEIPGLADAIRYRDASTPLTNFHYTRNPQGAIEGYENTPENTGPGWLPTTTPLTNLHLTGAWTGTGGMNSSIASGAGAAQQILAR